MNTIDERAQCGFCKREAHFAHNNVDGTRMEMCDHHFALHAFYNFFQGIQLSHEESMRFAEEALEGLRTEVYDDLRRDQSVQQMGGYPYSTLTKN